MHPFIRNRIPDLLRCFPGILHSKEHLVILVQIQIPPIVKDIRYGIQIIHFFIYIIREFSGNKQPDFVILKQMLVEMIQVFLKLFLLRHHIGINTDHIHQAGKRKCQQERIRQSHTHDLKQQFLFFLYRFFLYRLFLCCYFRYCFFVRFFVLYVVRFSVRFFVLFFVSQVCLRCSRYVLLPYPYDDTTLRWILHFYFVPGLPFRLHPVFQSCDHCCPVIFRIIHSRKTEYALVLRLFLRFRTDTIT